ncbi:hypothetical protein B0H14DRAFT_3709645 [Mycena olivaceomarginata]|nr:hypothetical protein B0H14DRAFT_3709645 [Mycena olivaceomarginata]
MRPRMEKREEEREREREEKRESGTCVTGRASTRSPHRPRRGGEGGGGEMMDGDGDEESAHDVRRPAAPHTPPVACAEREGHRWGGRSVGSHRCSGWGRQERAQARDLGVLCAHLPLRPLRAHPFIFPPGRGSAPSASITHHDRREHPTIHRCDSDGARAAPASPRYEGEDAGYGEGDEDGDGVGSDVGRALREAYSREGDEDKTAEMTPTSDVCAHVECARARDVEGGLPHEQQAQVALMVARLSVSSHGYQLSMYFSSDSISLFYARIKSRSRTRTYSSYPQRLNPSDYAPVRSSTNARKMDENGLAPSSMAVRPMISARLSACLPASSTSMVPCTPLAPSLGA